jgi:hypothetical protein
LSYAVAVANPLDDVYFKLSNQKILIDLLYARFDAMDKKMKVLDETNKILSERLQVARQELQTVKDFMRRDSEMNHYQMNQLRQEMDYKDNDIAIKLYEQMTPDREKERKKFLGLI